MFSRFLLIVVGLSICVVAVGLWHALDKPVRGFVIEGDLSGMERDELQATLSDTELRGILSTRLDAIISRVQDLHWAKDISVRRAWPDRFLVTLHKAAPVARWGDKQYVSAYGDLLELPDVYPGLPHFMVEVSNPQEAMQTYRLLDQIAARESLAISRLTQNSQGEWSVELSKGPRVLLGAEQINERMHRFLLVYRRVLSAGDKAAEYVDARYANGVAVRYVPEQQTNNESLLVAGADAAVYVEGRNDGR